MPLLRLLHQISNMYQNVKDAQNEFHEQPDVSKKSHAKDECSLGNSSKIIYFQVYLIFNYSFGAQWYNALWLGLRTL